MILVEARTLRLYELQLHCPLHIIYMPSFHKSRVVGRELWAAAIEVGVWGRSLLLLLMCLVVYESDEG